MPSGWYAGDMISPRRLPALTACLASLSTSAYSIEHQNLLTSQNDYLQQGREALCLHICKVLEEERRLARELELKRLTQQCIEALNAEDSPAALACIRAGVSPEQCNARGLTALQMAARLGRAELVAALLEAGAGADAAPNSGIKPLLYAVTGGHTECARLLLEHGAASDATPTSDLVPLVHAIMGGQDALVSLLLQHGATPQAEAMLKAVLTGRADYVQRLLAAGGNPEARGEFPGPGNSAAACRGTALIAAAERGYSDIVDILLAAGADLNAADENGRSALLRSIMAGRLSMAQKLIEVGADVTLRSRADTTALMAAAYRGNTGLYRLIVSKGGLEKDANRYGETMLMYAAMGGSCELIRHLAAQGADIAAQTGNKHTALHYAVKGGHYRATQLLLELGADPNAEYYSLSTYDTYTLPELAAAYATPELYTYLRSLCGDIPEASVTCAIRHGNKPMIRHLAANGADINTEYELLQAVVSGDICTVRTLIELGAEVKQHGARALECSIRNRRRDIAELLLKLDAPVNGMTPLIYAAQWGELGIFHALLSRVENPGACDSTGSNIAHYAAAAGHPLILRALAARGVSMTTENKYGNTPLSLAASKMHPEAMRTLCELGVPFHLPKSKLSDIWARSILYANTDMVRTLLELGAKPTDPCGFIADINKRKTAALYAGECRQRMTDKIRDRREILRLLTGNEEMPPAHVRKSSRVIYEAVNPQKH